MQMILAMVKISDPEYSIQPWQQWLLYAAILWLAVGINVLGSSYVPLFSKCVCKSCNSASLVAVLLNLHMQCIYP